MIFGHDHVDCANLFFSAARMCIYFDQHGFFDELGNKLLPRGFTQRFSTHAFRCSPPLEQVDWCQQALWFIEQGRSRALLESIIRGGEEIVPTPKKVLLTHVVDVVRAQSLLNRRFSSPYSTKASSAMRDSPHRESRIRYVVMPYT